MSGRQGLAAYIHPDQAFEACRAAYRTAIGSRFARHVVETFATRVVLIGVGLATSVLVARALGPDGRGLVAVAGTIAALGAQAGNLGLHASNTYAVAREPALLPALLGNSLVVSLVIGGLGAAASWATFAAWPGLAPVQGPLLALALAAVPFGLAAMFLQSLLLGLGEVRAYNAVELAARAGGIVLITLLIVLGTVTPTAVFGAGLVTLAGSVAFALWRCRRRLSRRPSPSLSVFTGNLRYGLKAYAAAVVAALLLRIDLLLVRYLLGVEAAGHYSVASAVGEMLSLLPAVVGTLLFPRLSALADPEARWRTTRRVVQALAVVMAIGTGAAAALSGPVIGLLFGEPFAPAAPALVALMPGVLALSVNVVLMNYFASLGMPVVTIYGPAVALAVGTASSLFLIPRLGLVGAGIGSTTAYAVMLSISLAYLAVRRRGGKR